MPFDYGRYDNRFARYAVQLEADYLPQQNGHRNQRMNCVPTSLAMAALHFQPGLKQQFRSGAELVGAIADTMLQWQGSTGVDGLRDYRVLGALGRALGLRLSRTPGIQVQALAQAVRAGHHAIVVGDAYALHYAASLNRALIDDAGHAILVHGFDPQAQLFQVNDPAEPARRERWVSPQELLGFVGALSRDLDGRAFGSTIYVSR